MIASKEQLAFERFSERFFHAFLLNAPVTASFIGRHEFDHLLPDYSPEGQKATLHTMQELLSEAGSFTEDDLLARQRLDRKLIQGYLETQIWEAGSQHFQKGNPSLYTSEAIFGLLVLVLTDYAPAALRFMAMASRIRAL